MRTQTAILHAGIIALACSHALAGQAAYSNFGNFVSNAGNIGQSSAVTLANAPMIVPFVSNTASMRVVFDEAASVNTIRVLSPMQFIQTSGNTGSPTAGLPTDGPSNFDPRTPQGNRQADISGLAPLRVSIYASAADVESRTAYASTDFSAGSFASNLWGDNASFLELTFDLGSSLDLAAGDWFVEVAQVDPASAQFFLALGEGDSLHRFNTTTLDLEGSNFEFALEIGSTVLIPIPAAGSLGIAGLIALGARARRRSL
jgi:hypothetical protein